MKDYTLLTKDTPILRKLDWDFLSFCKEYYDTVCCLMSDPSCKSSVDWSRHSHNIVDQCVFGEPNKKTKGRIGGWPAVWRAVDQVLHVGSCGNSHQYQAGSNCGLVQAVYIKRGKEWYYKFGPKTLKIIEKLKEKPMTNIVMYVPKDGTEELEKFLKESKFEFVSPFGSEKMMNELHKLQTTHLCICPNKKTYVLTQGTFENPEISATECIRKIGGKIHGESYGI